MAGDGVLVTGIELAQLVDQLKSLRVGGIVSDFRQQRVIALAIVRLGRFPSTRQNHNDRSPRHTDRTTM